MSASFPPGPHAEYHPQREEGKGVLRGNTSELLSEQVGSRQVCSVRDTSLPPGFLLYVLYSIRAPCSDEEASFVTSAAAEICIEVSRVHPAFWPFAVVGPCQGEGY